MSIYGEFYKIFSKVESNIFFLNPTDFNMREILRQYFINHPQSIDKYTFLQNSAFTHWVKEK
ncbi:hypothetical protein, partial [Clostridium perfringens]|uniref:hypothetical protein n=1 Tax=Clostridium perfringens TaxID=1502 RepID=UPI001A7E963F